MPNPWKPLVDSYANNPFMHKDPRIIFEEGEYNQVGMMIGGNRDEGCLYMTQFRMNPEKFEEVDNNFDEFGPMLFLGTDGKDDSRFEKKLAKKLLTDYTRSSKFEANAWKGIRNLFTDAMFLAPIDMLVNALQRTAGKPIFYYNYR